MTYRQELRQRADAVAKASAELTERCEAAIAAIDAAEARRAEDHKKSLAALDAIFNLIDNYGKPKEVAKTDHPVGIAFIEGVGIREVKP